MALGATAVVGANAQTFTVATFSDPTIGMSNPTPMFTVTSNSVSGGWSGTGLSLQTWMGVFNDVEFTMGSVATSQIVAGFYNMASGSVVFTTSTDSNLLTITFASGALAPNGLGGSDFWGNNVVFSGTLAAGTFTDEAFGFSFANPRQEANGVTYTASFTSSAVPEPASLAALAIGGVALLRRRKRA